MNESQFGFEYSWDDLRPVRPLVVVAFIFQITGALVGLWLWKYPDWYQNLWVGGAAATFPGYITGIMVQKLLRPNSLSENTVMVKRLGLVALFLSVIAVFSPPFGGAR